MESFTQQVASIAELIKDRRSVRVFKKDPVPRELIVELLNIAIWAPNHGNRQPWRFILCMDEGRSGFADAMVATYSAEERAKYGANRHEYLLAIPAHVVVIQKEDPRHKQWEEDYAAVCCLIQNFQLAAWERELGVVWKTNNYLNDPGFRASIGIQPGEKIVGILHVGFPEVVPPVRPRTAADELLTIIDKTSLSN
ncbi:nitroreductase family protein [Paenibacillus sp. YIM B09110]|uniref:nitroreductase family protein n=1 Tax=Paenibacillus sp. YIM B09110 TaxID=3126102 RepID=UPI00301C1931